MGTAKTHRLWHSFTIGSTVDTYLNTHHRYLAEGKPIPITCKQHIDRSVRYVVRTNKSLIPGEFGWFGIWPDITRNGRTYEGLQLDEIEYVMTKCLAYDAPISLETGFGSMDAHALTPAIIDIVGVYEKMRLDKTVPAETINMLKETGKDYAWIKIGDSEQFVLVKELEKVAGTHDIRSFAGQLPNGDAVATIWHYQGKPTKIMLPGPANAKVYCFRGKAQQTEKKDGKIVVPLDFKRLTIFFPETSADKAKQYLENAEIVPAS
jgi:hypothetical protein